MVKTYFILRLDSYTGEGSSLICSAANNDYMFAVLLVTGNNAEIVDFGYASVTELLAAWRDVHFENIERL
jgi:hypothetical protein